MPNDYMVRITHSYQDASGVVALWASRADKVVVYEHVGEATEKVHIHLVIAGCDTHKKQLRNIGMATGLPLKGNEYCSFKKFDGNIITMIYCTKGKFDPSFIKGYTMDEANKWKSQWRAHTKESNIERIYYQTFDDEDQDEISFKYWERDNPIQPRENLIFRRYKWVKEHARQSAFQKNKCFWTLKAINDYKTMVYTYCMRHNISIDPADDKVFKQY